MATEAIRGGGALPMIQSNIDTVSAEFGGDVNAQVAAMMMMSAHDKREQVQASRRSEDRYLCAMQDQQVASMREQAEHIRSAGQKEGIANIIAGGLQIAGAAWSAYGAVNAAPSADVKTGASTENTALEMLRASLPGMAAVTGGVGTLMAAGEKAEAAGCEADATEAGNHASASERRLDTLRDEEKDAQDMQRTAIDFLRDINQSKAGGDRAAIFQRA